MYSNPFLDYDFFLSLSTNLHNKNFDASLRNSLKNSELKPENDNNTFTHAVIAALCDN